MVKVGIVGVSGYSGLTALDILLGHPQVRVTYVSANNTVGKITDIWPKLGKRTNLTCNTFKLDEAVKNCDVIFLAVPHTVSHQITPKLLEKGVKVIDLSGDYRLNSPASYKKWYKSAHADVKNLKKAIYGLPELYREDIKKASLIANPGCYPTAAILGLAPLVSTSSKDIESIIIDAKSGVSGAGRKASVALCSAEVNENFRAYKILHHQHKPEIDLYLNKISSKTVNTNFVPHLLSVNHGIYETIYVHLKEKTTLNQIYTKYKKFYKIEPFVRLLKKDQIPELKSVVGTNFCDIGLHISESKDLLVITSAIDNLIKGAAGQAVQNMNLMCGFNETEGLL